MYTSTSITPTYFENAIGRLTLHPLNQHIRIDYHPGLRQGADLQAFLTQVGTLLVRWGWEGLLTTPAAMPDFTPDELAQVQAYWRAEVA